MAHPKFSYLIQGVDKKFTDEEEVLSHARKLAKVASLQGSAPSIRVTRYLCQNINQMDAAPYYVYSGERVINAV